MTSTKQSQSIEVTLPQQAYTVHVCSGGLARLADYLPSTLTADASAYAIVTNTRVAPLYLPTAAASLDTLGKPLINIILPDGERYKTWETLQTIFDGLLTHACDRRVVLVALGGGVVGDMTGFAAASYLRGVRFVQVPTTLLAQVDSSVGGKTGINHPLGKNMIGAFHQPQAVLVDPQVLRTLPGRELSAGLAELIKHGLIYDARFVEVCQQQLSAMRAVDETVLNAAIVRSIAIKAAIVMQDEREQGIRAHLNFGHTFGHAIEAVMGYGEWLHGEAVACGMVLAARVSKHLGMLSTDEVHRVEQLVMGLGGPTRLPVGPSVQQYLDAMRVDKKTLAGQLRFVVLQAIGCAEQRIVPEAVIAQVLLEAGAAA